MKEQLYRFEVKGCLQSFGKSEKDARKLILFDLEGIVDNPRLRLIEVTDE